MTPEEPGRGYGEKKERGKPSKAHCRLEGRSIKSAEWSDRPPNSACTNAQGKKRGKLRILQGKNTGWSVRRIISRRNVKEIKMNVISGDNLKNPLKDMSKIVRF